MIQKLKTNTLFKQNAILVNIILVSLFQCVIPNYTLAQVDSLELRKKDLITSFEDKAKYETAKEIGQLSETLGDFTIAIDYYQICLDSLGLGTQKEEYSYINAHLITCQFLLQAKAKSEKKEDVVLEKEEKMDTLISKEVIKENDNVVEEKEENALKSRNWLKRIAKNIQRNPKISNSVESLRKVNIALALINQWGNEKVPGKHFEFIDEQLGVVTNLIDLILGNELIVEVQNGKLSTGDKKLTVLLENVEAIRQLKDLERKEFTKEELEAVMIQNERTSQTTYSIKNYDKYTGYYRLKDFSNESIINPFASIVFTNNIKKPEEWTSKIISPDDGIPCETTVKFYSSYLKIVIIDEKFIGKIETTTLNTGYKCNGFYFEWWSIKDGKTLTGKMDFETRILNYTCLNVRTNDTENGLSPGTETFSYDSKGQFKIEFLPNFKLNISYVDTNIWGIFEKVGDL